MKINDIEIGTRLTIITEDKKTDDKNKKYISQLQNILNSDEIIIAAPIYEGNIILFSIGTLMEISFFYKKIIYMFKGEVIARRRENNVIQFKVRKVSNFIKIQRRDYFRFDWVIPIIYKVVQSSSEEFDLNNSEYVDAYTKDISAGGVATTTTICHNLNDIIDIKLLMEYDKSIITKGKIVRINRNELDSSRYDVGIEFIGISTKDRDYIVRYIFQKQSMLKRKGMK